MKRYYLIAILTTAASLPMFASENPWQFAMSFVGSGQPVLAQEETQETPWRLTRFGWEDATTWNPVNDRSPESVPGLHPLAWAAILTLSVLSILIWASEPDELAAILPGVVQQRERKKPESDRTPTDSRS